MPNRVGDHCACAVLALLPGLLFAAIAPWGDFPLNDDWQFGLAARELAEHGALRILPYSAMTLVGQVSLGALVWKVAPGFVGLRLLTLAFWMGLGPAVYWGARELGRDRWASAAAAIAVAACPLVVLLGTTFMTDVPFLTLWAVAAAAYLRALRKDSLWFTVLGSLAAAAASSIRQPGVLLPTAYGIGILLSRTPRWRRHLVATALTSLAALAPTAVTYLGATGTTAAFRSKLFGAPIEAVTRLPGGVWAIGCYLGLFLCPLLLLGADALRRRPRRWVWTGMLVALALAQAKWGFLTGSAKTFPYVGNLLHNMGFGPISLTDAREQPLVFAVVSAPVQVAFSVVVAVLSGLLVVRLLGSRTAMPPAAKRFLCLAGALYAGLILLTTRTRIPLFDRYLLPLLPILAIAAAPRAFAPRRARFVLAVSAAALLLGFAVTGVRDYHRWNDARWDLCRVAEARGGTPRTIDGGFEYSGWHNGLQAYFGTFRRADGWMGWWVEDPVWVVGVRPRPGYERITSRGVRLWLGRTDAELTLFRREE